MVKKPVFELKKQPVQERSRFTVEVIREAAAHILREDGVDKFTTNRIAEKAGVSIGSLYQYFPSKEVLIAEVKRHHFAELRDLFEEALDHSLDKGLPVLVRKLIEASVKAHRLDPILHKILSGDLTQFELKEDDRSEKSIRFFIENILERYKVELRENLDIHTAALILYKIIETVIHDAVIRNPENFDTSPIVDELCFLVLAYLEPK